MLEYQYLSMEQTDSCTNICLDIERHKYKRWQCFCILKRRPKIELATQANEIHAHIAVCRHVHRCANSGIMHAFIHHTCI